MKRWLSHVVVNGAMVVVALTDYLIAGGSLVSQAVSDPKTAGLIVIGLNLANIALKTVLDGRAKRKGEDDTMILDEHVTPNFALSEFIVSDTAARMGIDNTPPAAVLATLRNVLIPAMEDVRTRLGVPVVIKSGYRCPELNSAVHGAPASDHLTGHAADFVAPGFGSPREVAKFLVDQMPQFVFDQLIHEGGWVHVSFSPHRRNEVLTAHFTPSGVSYTPGLA
jgi:zinc D-Ala-D-Ala carboxypeptidase